MNSLPPPLKKHSTRRAIRRPSHLFSSPRRGFLYPRLHQLYRHMCQHTPKAHTPRTNPPLCLSCSYHNHPPPPLPPRLSRRHHYAPYRSEPKHLLLRSLRRRRPSPFPTPILIFRPPRSLYPYLTWIWRYFPHRHQLCWQKRGLWHPRHNLCNSRNRNPRLHRLGPSHIHSWHRRRHPRLLHSCNHNYRSTHRN